MALLAYHRRLTHLHNFSLKTKDSEIDINIKFIKMKGMLLPSPDKTKAFPVLFSSVFLRL